MDDRLELLVSTEICVIQNFGRNLLECIRPGCVITVQRTSAYARMVEILWRQEQYLAFERDLEERTQLRTVKMDRGEFGHAA